MGRTFPIRDSTPCRPNGSPLCTILRYPFLVTDLIIFPIFTTFERGVRAEKTQFFGQNFPKMPQNAFFYLFFFRILPAPQKFGQNKAFVMLCESLENHFGRPKKKIDNIFEIFLKVRPLLEKILDPPLL